jgi:hypothetical protein
MSIDPEEYGTFKGQTRAKLKIVVDDVKKISVAIDKLGKELKKDVLDAKEEFLKALRDHMGEEEKGMRAQVEVNGLQAKAISDLGTKFDHVSKVVSEAQPAIALLEKIIIILEFLTWRNMFFIATLVFLVLGILVPVSQNMFPPDSVPGQIIDALTYGPHLIKEFT